MANVTRIRVEQRHSGEDARSLHTRFKRRVNEAGILAEYKLRQRFESTGEKRRRKLKEAKLARKKEQQSLERERS